MSVSVLLNFETFVKNGFADFGFFFDLNHNQLFILKVTVGKKGGVKL